MSTPASLAFTAVVLRRLLRDPISLFFMIVLPVIVIVVIGATFGGQGRLDLGIVHGGNGGPYAARVARALRAGDGITVHIYRTVADMRQAARRETIAGGIVLGPRFEQAVRTGATARIPFVASPAADQAFSAEVTLRGALAPLGDRVTAARVATHETGKPFAAAFVLADRLGGTAPPSVRVRFVGHSSAAVLSRFSRTAPQNLVLFVFITSLSSAALIVQARRQGVLRRALATRTGMGTILVGLGLGWFSIALVQSAIILFVGGVVFGVDWGSPLPAALLVVDFALLGCGAGLLLGALGRDEDRVSSIAPILGLVLGALGGCMVPLEVFPPGMITLAHVVPQYWAVRSWQSLIFDGAGVSTIATALAVLAAYAAALTAAAVFLLRRSLTR